MRRDGPTSATLRVEIYSWWRSGLGVGRAAQLDALCARDRDGLPYLPGRHVKGLMRDAVRRLALWVPEQWSGAEDALFGEPGFRKAAEDGRAEGDAVRVPYRGARPGALAFSDARLSRAERSAFVQDAEQARASGALPLRDDLFASRRTTAMRDGVAAPTSLRAEEVAVPVTLFGEVGFVGAAEGAPWSGSWLEALEAAAPLIRSVGAKRMRGLGRAAVFVMEADHDL